MRQNPCHILPELAQALVMLDTDRDGKVWESDVETAVSIACGGARLSESNWWESVKESCLSEDGLVKLRPLLESLQSGPGISQMLVHGDTKGCEGKRPLGPFHGICQYVSTFNSFDTDRNGIICARDLKKVLERIRGVPHSLEECKRLIQRVDSNGDGVIDLAEFGALAASLLPPKKAPALEQLTEDEEEEEKETA